MRRFLTGFALAGVAALAAAASPALPTHTAPAGARVYIISPTDGATVGRDATVRFGLSGMGVAPAGVAKKYTGHHRLLIDGATLPAPGQPIPNGEHHKHFGGGQIETVLHLSPGTHTH